MKTRNIFAFAALGLLGLSACSSEDELTTGNQDQPIQFEVSIENKSQARTNPGDDTKSTQFNTGDQISITSADKTCIYKFQGTNWTPAEGQTPFSWTTASMTFSAQYPLADTANGFTVPTDQSDANKMAAADYMTCTKQATFSKDPIVLTMQRQMARVDITGFTFTGDLANKNAQVKAVTFYSKNVVGGSTEPQWTEVKAMPMGQGYLALLAPVAQTPNQNFAKISVSFEDNGTKNEDFFVTNTPELLKGNKYAFSMKVNMTKVEMQTVSIAPWTEGTGADLNTKDDVEPAVDTSAHKVTLKEAGSLDTTYLQEAFGTASTGTLTVEGPANDSDLQAIATFCKQSGKAISLDLSSLTGITALPANSFKDCTALTQITLPANVNTLSENAFANSGLTGFNVPAGCTTLPVNSFKDCTALTQITLPSSVITIEGGALSNTGLTEFTVLQRITTLGEGFLSGCTNLASINISHEKTESYRYDKNAFSGVGIKGKDVTLNLHASWKEGLLTGDETKGYSFLGGTFKTVQEIVTISATQFNDAGICIEQNDFLNKNIVTSVTYEALVNFDSFDGNDNRNNTIMGKERTLLLRVGDAGNIGDNITQLCIQAEDNLTVDETRGFKTNTWYHLAMTYNASDGKTCIYINGELVKEKTSNINKSFNLAFIDKTADYCVSIGRFANFQYGNRPFDGKMKEVRIWNVARTAEQIYANMLNVEPQTEGLKVYYKLDGTDIINGTVKNSATGKADGTIYTGNGGSLTAVTVDPIVIQ